MHKKQKMIIKITGIMKNPDSRTRRWLLLAEKLLANQHIEECLDVCDEVELMVADMKEQGLDKNEEKIYMQKLKNIKLKLNSIMASKVRQALHCNKVTM